MLRFLAVPVLLAAAATAAAQQGGTTYQKQKPSSFHVEGLIRQEWTDTVTFQDTNRRLYRLRPRGAITLKWFEVGLGGDFNYATDHNLDPPPGMVIVPLLRDNYVSRDARLDLAWAKFTP